MRHVETPSMTCSIRGWRRCLVLLTRYGHSTATTTGTNSKGNHQRVCSSCSLRFPCLYYCVFVLCVFVFLCVFTIAVLLLHCEIKYIQRIHNASWWYLKVGFIELHIMYILCSNLYTVHILWFVTLVVIIKCSSTNKQMHMCFCFLIDWLIDCLTDVCILFTGWHTAVITCCVWPIWLG